MADDQTQATPASDGAPAAFFKRASKSRNIRKRDAEQDPDVAAGTDEKSVIQAPTKAAKWQETEVGSSKKKDDGAGTSGVFVYESDRRVQVTSDNGATRVLETETDFSQDARAIRERVLKQAQEDLKGEKTDDKIYRGMHAYKDYMAGFRREHTVASEKAGGNHGPLRASQHIRWSVRFDYQPDICKDYKETGTCGYGDACKFMHDRGDYKSGWQMEREWTEKEKKRKEMLAQGLLDGDDVDEDGAQNGDNSDDELPFACFICREPFKEPVVTKCQHYFCAKCALEHNAKSKRCYVCDKPTDGVFNVARDILKKRKEMEGKT